MMGTTNLVFIPLRPEVDFQEWIDGTNLGPTFYIRKQIEEDQ